MSDTGSNLDTELLGQLRFTSGRYEFHCPQYQLVVRGRYIEWVMEAAAEVIYRTEQLKSEGSIEEKRLLSEFDEHVTEIDIDMAKWDHKTRFDQLPQCIVSLGSDDFRWVHPDGRKDDDRPCTQRIVDQSLTRETGSWLKDEPVVN